MPHTLIRVPEASLRVAGQPTSLMQTPTTHLPGATYRAMRPALVDLAINTNIVTATWLAATSPSDLLQKTHLPMLVEMMLAHVDLAKNSNTATDNSSA